MGRYYQYRIRVYCPWTQAIETSYATDPYSRSLAANSARSHIVDIRDAALPPGWAQHAAPRLDAWTDISVYELHVRDFRCACLCALSRVLPLLSISVPDRRNRVTNAPTLNPHSAHDESVPAHLRGKYLAFAQQGSTGTQRLKELADAGISHIHLLPSYDFGSVPERAEEQRVPEVRSMHKSMQESMHVNVCIAHMCHATG